MAHYFIYNLGEKSDAGQWLEQNEPSSIQWSEPYKGKVKAKGWMSVRAAITAIQRNHSLSELLKDCIAFTGDVDTVAAIALACASQSRGYQQDLPQHLIDTLENDTYGRDYIVQLDLQLSSKIHQQ